MPSSQLNSKPSTRCAATPSSASPLSSSRRCTSDLDLTGARERRIAVLGRDARKAKIIDRDGQVRKDDRGKVALYLDPRIHRQGTREAFSTRVIEALLTRFPAHSTRRPQHEQRERFRMALARFYGPSRANEQDGTDRVFARRSPIELI